MKKSPLQVALSEMHVISEKSESAAKARQEAWLKFGRLIRIERRKTGFQLKPFAIAMGCTSCYISYLESGKRQWNFEMARKAVKLLSK